MSEHIPQPIDADDPGLTAYALGELEGADAARYAAAVTASPELLAVVVEIQAEARILSKELRLEPQVPMTAERRAEILARANSPQPVNVPQRKRLLGVSRRTAVVAASVLFVPGAWYAFQRAFPRMQFRPLVAHQEAAVALTGEERRMLTTLSYAGSQSSTREEVQKPNVHPHLGAATDPASDPFVETSRNESFQVRPGSTTNATIARPGPMVNGPGPGVLETVPGAMPRDSSRRRFSDPASSPTEFKDSDAAGEAGHPTDDTLALSLGDLSDQSKESGGSATGKPGRVRLGLDLDVAGGRKLPGSGSAKESKPLLKKTLEKQNLASLGYAGGQPKDRLSAFATNPLPAVSFSAPWASDSKPTRELLSRESRRQEVALSERKHLDDGLELQKMSESVLDGEGTVNRWRRIPAAESASGEAYHPIFENAFVTPQEQQLSTFSIDVDSASYANLRRFLQGGQLPPPDAVRIEELVNYFAYQYPQPQAGRPFSVQTDIAACPWQPGHQLVRIGLKGKEIPKAQRSPTNLVFLVDVSGSMQAQNKLPLVRESLTTLVNQLDERDKVAIVTYAGEAGVRLPSTSLAQKEVVLSAIAGLGAGGSTNGAAGINTAYDIAAQEFLEQGTNRVILCTDGDFNVGVTSDAALVQMIQTRAKGGVFLSVFGFGMGNLQDAKLEQLADKGNGQYGYIDDLQEANKVFVQELMGTLVTIAKDVKIQIDFNQEAVASYRLVGYENRLLAAEDFHDDKKDAGEIGAGHTVTALYEIIPAKDLQATDQTRWLTVKLRYKQPDSAVSVLLENPLVGQPGQLKLASSDFQFAASVAACGMLLRHSQHAGQANWGLVKELAQSGLSYDPHGHRRGFLGLVAQAESLQGQLRPAPSPATDSTVGGKYKSLLRRIQVAADTAKYGQFKDFGHSDMKSYAGSENLPEGYWVYVAPYWYIWAETTQKAEK